MMAILSEVCAFTPRGKYLVRRTYTVCMLWLMGVALASIIICGAPRMARGPRDSVHRNGIF